MNTYRATLLQFGRYFGTVEVEAENASAVSQCFIDGVGDFDFDVEGLTLGEIDLAEVPDRYAEPNTLFEHLVCWHLDTDSHSSFIEAVADAEDQARRQLDILKRLLGAEAVAGWAQNRAALNTLEESDNPPLAREWEASDEHAVELLYAAFDALQR